MARSLDELRRFSDQWHAEWLLTHCVWAIGQTITTLRVELE
jgi:hypothetical protein